MSISKAEQLLRAYTPEMHEQFCKKLAVDITKVKNVEKNHHLARAQGDLICQQLERIYGVKLTNEQKEFYFDWTDGYFSYLKFMKFLIGEMEYTLAISMIAMDDINGGGENNPAQFAT
jgi:hypothetical protein